MAILNTRFYKKEDDELYSDGSIENVIYERVCKGDNMLENDPDWAVFYHFSPIRQNILNWYPFEKDCSVLEIGAGCGALTGMLAHRAAHVTSCELTMRRAKILFQRHKDLDNLEVCVGNFLLAEFERKYDYIVINGVLEYSRSIMGDRLENPFVAFLNHAKSYLKPNGTILLAIENRLGLKYLAGAPEDHVGKIFSGINGYRNGESVRTFSKAELEQLFQDAQLIPQRWYYPYPDYKFPLEIFTDDSINSKKPVSLDIPFDMRRAGLFDKQSFYEALMKDKTAGNFSNSFLVELGMRPDPRSCKPTYAKISSNRKKEFAVATVLYEKNGFVEKNALYPSGYEHIRKMAERKSSNQILQPVNYDTSVNGKLKYSMVEDDSLRTILTQAVTEGNTAGFWNTFRTLYDSLYTTPAVTQPEDPQFETVFGPEKIAVPLHWEQNVNIDLNVDNLFRKRDFWQIIDNEWEFAFPIPVEYALWRVLSQLLEETAFASVLSEQAINDFLKISEAEVTVFRKWEVHFAARYVGIQDLSVHYQQVIPLDVDSVLEREKQNNILVSHLFLFLNNNEVEVLECVATNNNGVWSTKFCSDNIRTAAAIRWDPLEGSACRITDIQAEGLELKPANADPEEPNYTFATFDPQFAVEGDTTQLSEIRISFRCELLDWTQGFFKLETDRNRERELRLHETALKEQAIKNLNDTSSAYHAEMDRHEQYAIQKEQQIKELNQTIIKYAQDMETLDLRLQQINTDLRNKTEEAEQIRCCMDQQVDALRCDLNKTVQENEAYDQQVNTLRDDLSKAVQENEAYGQQVTSLQQTLDDLRQQVSNHKLRSIWQIIRGRLL